MSKFNINIKATWKDVVRHLLRILFSVIAILAFKHYFPENLLPKYMVFKIVLYMLIYILVSLIVDSFFKKDGKKDSKK